MSNRIVSRLALFGQLDRAGRITQVSAPAGSGKTTLLRSWIDASGRAGQAAYVSARGDGRDPQRFWISVVDALRGTAAGSAVVRPLTAAPELDGWVVVEHLLTDLSRLPDRTWLIVDDLHELGATETLRQLQLLMMRAPAELRLLLTTRHDMRLGLHRLRLDGELTEIRASNLRFTLGETRALFEAAGLDLSERTIALLLRRTEGWAAGLRLAALSLDGHPDPDRFAAEFSGSERTVAEYLLAEVLEQQPAPVRRLLLRTSVLDRVNGQLADLLTASSGSERILLDLEKAGAFVVAVDPQRSWFRYHRLFADLLQLELRRTGSEDLPALHGTAARWYAANGHPADAVRHAQAAQCWDLAARLLSDHRVDLYLNGRIGTVHELLAGFPEDVAEADVELSVLMAARDLDRGSLREAEQRLALAVRRSGAVAADRRDHFEVMCTIVRLRLARRQGDLPAVVEDAQRLLSAVETTDPMQSGLGDGLRAMALVSLGSAEIAALRLDGANRHLEQGIALARRIGRPYLELAGLVHDAQLAMYTSYTAGLERSRQAIELAREQGWSDEPVTAVALAVHGAALIAQGRLAEAEPWIDHAQRTLQPGTNPVAEVAVRYSRASFELARGEYAAALAALEAVERLAHTLVTPHVLSPLMRAQLLHARVRLGETRRVEQALAEMAADERGSTASRTVEAALRLAQGDPRAARDVLAARPDDSRAAVQRFWNVVAILLDAMACDALGRADAAGVALQRALDAAEPDHVLLPFLLHPAPDLLKRHVGRGGAHRALLQEILGQLGAAPATVTSDAPANPREPLSGGEMRVLRYLPTNLSAPEIAAEMSLSVNTVRTHMRHVYEKLGAHKRLEAVELARALGLVAPAAGHRMQMPDTRPEPSA